MGKQGGYRPGAGRKKEQRTIEKEKSREFLINRIAKDLEPIVTAQIEAAKGMYVQNMVGSIYVKVYRKLPVLSTGEYLLDQAAGKPVETMKVEEDVKLKIDI